jgi:hypothetical protein
LRLVAVAVAQAGDHDQAAVIARSIAHHDEQAQALHAIIDRLEPDRRRRLLAHQIRLVEWHKSSCWLHSASYGCPQ